MLPLSFIEKIKERQAEIESLLATQEEDSATMDTTASAEDSKEPMEEGRDGGSGGESGDGGRGKGRL